MADGTIQLNAGTGGKVIDAEELSVSGNTVERTRQQWTGALAAEIARVMNTPPVGTEYGGVVRSASQPLVTDRSGSGVITAGSGAPSVVVAPTGGASTIVFNVTGTFVATWNVEGTFDPTASDTATVGWSATLGFVPGNGNVINVSTGVTPIVVACGGFAKVRIRASAFTSGSVAVAWNAGAGANATPVYNTWPAAFQVQVQGAPSPANPVIVARRDGDRVTYSATIIALAPALLATDILTIQGSATKVVRVLRITVRGTQTIAGTAQIQIVKRSAADTGGTSTTLTDVPHDSGDVAGTALVKAFTANPTALGALVGPIRSGRIFLPAPGSAVESSGFVEDFGVGAGGKAAVLRGVAETLAVNLNGVTLTGASLALEVEFTEE